MYAGARDRLFKHVRLEIKEERCIAAFSDQNQSTPRPKDCSLLDAESTGFGPKHMGQSRSSVLL